MGGGGGVGDRLGLGRARAASTRPGACLARGRHVRVGSSTGPAPFKLVAPAQPDPPPGPGPPSRGDDAATVTWARREFQSDSEVALSSMGSPGRRGHGVCQWASLRRPENRPGHKSQAGRLTRKARSAGR